jgi:poly(A) polymerase
MSQHLKDAIGICKTIMRNGYDAYVINSVLQDDLLNENPEAEVEIATELTFEELKRIFPQANETYEGESIGTVKEGEGIFRFFSTDTSNGAHPEASVVKLTPRLLKKLEERQEIPFNAACPYIPQAQAKEAYEGFIDFNQGEIRFIGLPDETLKNNYLLGLKALRFAANFQLPIGPNTWVAIVRNARLILDYVPVSEIIEEWKKVEAENLWQFVQLLFDCQLLHGLIPEVAALSRINQVKNQNGEEETVLEHTLQTMRYYPEQLPYDWYGTIACLFHDVGKLNTAEYVEGKWTFYQHHHVGAKITRRILKRLLFLPEDIDLICNLVRHHMRFSFMLTDKGIRRFKSLDDYPRIIEIARANIKARDDNYTAFNHNMKYLEKADIPEEMSEPLLNGNEIMEFANLKPGPMVGTIRDALLKAQIAGEVTSVPEAVDFVCSYKQN